MTVLPRVTNNPDSFSLTRALQNGPLGNERTALGRGLDSLLATLGPNTQDEAAMPLPRLKIDGDMRTNRPLGVKSGALLNRLQSSYRHTGQAMNALLEAMPTVDQEAPRTTMESTAVDADVWRGSTPTPFAGTSEAEECTIASGFNIIMMETHLIHPNPFVPLSKIDRDGLDRLAESIRVHGFLRPLVVMPSTVGPVLGSEGYWLITGERSWQVARLLGLQRIPVRVQEVSPREAIQIILAEDWHAQRLPAVDRAQLCDVLLTQMGMSVDGIAQRLAVDFEDVEATLSYLTLDGDIQESMTSGVISEAITRLLITIPDTQLRHELWRYTIRYQWSPQRLQRAIKQRLERAEPDAA